MTPNLALADFWCKKTWMWTGNAAPGADPLQTRTSYRSEVRVKLPGVRWDDRRGTWFSAKYLEINLVKGRPKKSQRDFRSAEPEREAQRMSDEYWSNYDRVSGRSVDGTLEGWTAWHL